MTALAAGCPLTLLIDLTDAHGPDSKRIMAREHADMSWLQGLGRTAPRRAIRTQAAAVAHHPPAVVKKP